MKTDSKALWLALPWVFLGTFSLLYFGALAPQVLPGLFSGTLVDNAFVDGKLKYQLVTLLIALGVLGIVRLCARQNAAIFYHLGDLRAPAQPLSALGIKTGDTWKAVGTNFAVIVSLATGLFIYLNVAQGQSLEPEHVRYLPFVLLLSALNAFTEEAITRLSVVTLLFGRVSPAVICTASALLFGIPHYFGVPGGPLGALMAGFLGWLLAKSILETRGLFWAWWIHFLLDVIIFTALFWVAL